MRFAIKTLSAMAAIAVSACLAQAGLSETPQERRMEGRDHVNQGNYLMSHKQFQAAIDEYKKALEIDPNNSVAKDNIVLCHNNWGNFYFQQGQYKEAQNEWQTALTLDPHCQMARHNMAIMKATLEHQAPEGGAGTFETGKTDQAQQGSPPSAVLLSPAKKAGNPPESNAAPALNAEPAANQMNTRINTGMNAQSSGSLEDLLSALEIKIYGHRQANMPVLKRLETLEMDTAGQTRAGTIKDRLETLRKNYGM